MTRLRRSPIPPLLIAWVALGVVRLLLGSSTSLAAYFFFGLFWLASAALLIVAIRQLVISRMQEERIEAIAVCVALVSLFAQGLLGSGHTIAFAALAFFTSVIVLLFIYGRRLRQGHPIPS